ncbi:MAG: NAD(P)-binding domain-containing protein [Nannocystaceae bacterium]|nr:NAD(P)-binding domain-containing protein [Nannocystaceae bacterium]
MRTVRNLIIGAGPAGLQLAHLLDKRGEEYLVLERGEGAGTFFESYPRHDRLLSINKIHTGYPDLESRRRYDWNALLCDDEAMQFREFSADYFPTAAQLVTYLQKFAEHYQIEVAYKSNVVRVSKVDERFEVALDDGTRFASERLFIATGVPLVNNPDIPGVELCEPYDRFSVDPDDYIDQRVFIVGKGNSAFETADALISTTRKMWVCGETNLKLAWASHYVGHLRAVNNNFLDTYQLKAQNNILDGNLRAVRKDDASGDLIADVWFESRQQTLSYPCDRVLLCTGFRSDLGIFDASTAPTRRQCGRLPAMTSEWESVNVPDMFFIGTLMQSRDYRKTMSAFIHGFRHNIESLMTLLDKRDGKGLCVHPAPLPGFGRELASALIDRFSTSAALMLQPGFLGDVVLPSPGHGPAEHIPELPVDYVMETVVNEHPALYVLTLEYGKSDKYMDPFAMPRGVGVTEDFYIHPIVRYFENGELVDRFFLPDDLDNDWRDNDKYISDLAAWIDAHPAQLQQGAAT